MEIILYNGPSAIVGANVCECDIENEHTCSLEYRGVGMCTSLISQAGNRGGHGVCMYVCMYVVQYKLPTAGDKKKTPGAQKPLCHACICYSREQIDAVHTCQCSHSFFTLFDTGHRKTH